MQVKLAEIDLGVSGFPDQIEKLVANQMALRFHACYVMSNR